MSKIYLLVFFVLGQSVYGAKILGIVPTASYSHQIALRPIFKALSSRGHEITLITTDPDPTATNMSQIDVGFVYEIIKRLHFTAHVEKHKNDFFKMINLFRSVANKTNTAILENDEVQKLIREDEDKFDVVLIEFLNAPMYAFAKKFNAPFIGLLSIDAPNIIHETLGNPTHPIAYPEILLAFSKDLAFVERLISCFVWACMKVMAYQFAEQDSVFVKKYFGDGYPSMEYLHKNVDMLFLNANPVFSVVRPVGPATVYIGGGLHIQEAKPLAKELQNFLDEAKEGVIYFSLGSNIKSKDLTDLEKKVLMETFSELPYNVLWKFEADELPGKPANVKIVKWAPQQDVLRHPNIKVFITQGGLQSIDEAIFNRVPLVGMPFFGDQQNNVKRLVDKGICLAVDHFTIEKDSFKSTILEVINNPVYRANINELATLILDQPMTGLEKAIWWTEYVIRHKGAKHLRSPVVDLPSYQYYLLDVIGFMAAIMFVVFLVIYKCTKLMCKFIRYRAALILKKEKSKVN